MKRYTITRKDGIVTVCNGLGQEVATFNTNTPSGEDLYKSFAQGVANNKDCLYDSDRKHYLIGTLDQMLNPEG